VIKLHGVEKMREALGLSSEQLETIIASIMPDTIKLSSFLETDIGTVDEILARANKEMWRSFLTVQNLFRERQELTRQLLLEERQRGAMESKNIAIATLSHYINNATAGWYGHIQLLRQKLNRQDDQRLIKDLPASLDVMENAIKRILAVIAEIKEISPIDDVSFYHMSQAMNIDERVIKRLKTMSIDSEVVTSEEQTLV
jgi:signal transduction histidine kinase